MPILALLTARAWAAVAGAVLIVALFWWGYNATYARGAESIQTKWDAAKLQDAQQSAKIAADALTTTKELQSTIDTQRSQTNAQIASLNANLNRALVGLRNRPSRDSAGNLPRNPTTGAALGATGADLLRQDGEFLSRESARADTLRLQLIGCQAAYEAARDALK